MKVKRGFVNILVVNCNCEYRLSVKLFKNINDFNIIVLLLFCRVKLIWWDG